jgi:hypothetical protein
MVAAAAQAKLALLESGIRPARGLIPLTQVSNDRLQGAGRLLMWMLSVYSNRAKVDLELQTL